MGNLLRKRSLAALSVVFPVLSIFLLNEALAVTPAKPNIVFILADDLGWNDVGIYGSSSYKTPNIDALARQGMVFTQAHAANAMCSPTRASIMSGQFPARLGITAPACHEPEARMKATLPSASNPENKCLDCISANRLDTSIVTLAEVLRAAGYATGHFGKWHLGPEPYSPLEQGFDVDVPHSSTPGLPRGYLAPWRFEIFPAAPGKFVDSIPATPGAHIEDRMALEAVKFIEANKHRPFFLNYWAFSVHSMYNAKPELVEQFRKSTVESLPQHNPVYAAMVHSLDDAVGTLVKGLESAGLMDKTLIIFFSDNGGVNWPALRTEASPEAKTFADVPPTSNSPLRGGKASIYEGGTREPCFVVWPGVVKPGTRTDAMIQSMDFYPTLVAIAGAKLPPNQIMDGRSFLPVIEGSATSLREEIFGFLPHTIKVSDQVPAASVRQGDWKLIRFLHDGPARTHRYELYNLRDDPGEARDLSSMEPGRVAALDARIESFLKETCAVVPGPNPAYAKQPAPQN